MSLTFKNLTIKNFLSTGAVTQTINLERHDLTLILGENLDLGGDGARNGTGKSTILQALSYVLFGEAITSIRKDNLINRTNTKQMLITLDFLVDGVAYRIERGRKPNLLRFYVNDQVTDEQNDAQGENRETQADIERVLNLSADMFKNIIALNTYTTPFLSMKAAEQRNMIEQLLGITLLSERAEILKEKIKQTKDSITKEDYRIKATEEANKRVIEQVEALKRRQRVWQTKHEEDVSTLLTEVQSLSSLDIEAELAAHRELAVWNANQEKLQRYETLLTKQQTWKSTKESEISKTQQSLDKLLTIDIAAELLAHQDLVKYTENVRLSAERDSKLLRLKQDIQRDSTNFKKLNSEVTTLKEHKCYACGQEFHDDKQAQVLTSKVEALAECQKTLDDLYSQQATLESNPIYVGTKPITHYKSESDAYKHNAEVERLQTLIKTKQEEADPYADQLIENSVLVTGTKPVTHYKTEADAVKHSGKVETLLSQIESKLKEVDPYTDQIKDMEDNTVQKVDYTTINEASKYLEHQKFLLDLLTNKDSFVRKRIIDQNLSFLNNRLTHYLEAIGLPHQVVFNNDLSVDITELGREMDFANLSRGEMNRVILALSFAFRDVYESLYQPINTIFVDELMDSGMDTVGMENGVGLLKSMSRDRSKSVWLISHRDELSSRVNSVLKVIKSGGFTTYVDE
jgi:DNA repair exonuclease SbcCD ATPase subunit